jgi:hypothetical protein
LDVAGSIGNDELALGSGEVAVGHIDGDALFPLTAQAIGEQCQIKLAAFGYAGDLIFVDTLGIVKQTADESGFTIVNAAGCGKTKKPFQK